MQPTHDTRIADLIGDLTALSTALGALHRDGAATDEETLAECEEFEHRLRFDCLTNNLRDGWRLSSAADHSCVPTSSPPTEEERRAAAPFASLLIAAENLHAAVVCGTFDGDPAEVAETVAEVQEALAGTVEELAALIGDLIAGRVTLPPLLAGDALAAAQAEGDALCAALEVECDAIRAADALAAAGDA